MDRHQITELFRDTWGQHSENRTIAYMECCEGIFDCMELRFCLAQRGFIVPSSNPDDEAAGLNSPVLSMVSN